jgi:ribosomal protein S27E
MARDPGDVRCLRCGRLLARQVPGGGVEVRRSRLPAFLLHRGSASLTCDKCGAVVEVHAATTTPHELKILHAAS